MDDSWFWTSLDSLLHVSGTRRSSDTTNVGVLHEEAA
jgi:hypothetical protein